MAVDLEYVKLRELIFRFVNNDLEEALELVQCYLEEIKKLEVLIDKTNAFSEIEYDLNRKVKKGSLADEKILKRLHNASLSIKEFEDKIKNEIECSPLNQQKLPLENQIFSLMAILDDELDLIINPLNLKGIYKALSIKLEEFSLSFQSMIKSKKIKTN